MVMIEADTVKMAIPPPNSSLVASLDLGFKQPTNSHVKLRNFLSPRISFDTPKFQADDWISCSISTAFGENNFPGKIACKVDIGANIPELTFKIGWPLSDKDSNMTLISALKIPGTDYAIIAANPSSPFVGLDVVCIQNSDKVGQFIMRSFKNLFASTKTIADTPKQASQCSKAINNPTTVELVLPDGQTRKVSLNPKGSINQGIFKVVEIDGELNLVLGDPSNKENLVPMSELEEALKTQVRAASGMKNPATSVFTGQVTIDRQVLESIPQPTPTPMPTEISLPQTIETPQIAPDQILPPMTATTREQGPGVTDINGSFILTPDGKSTVYVVKDSQIGSKLHAEASNPLADSENLGQVMNEVITTNDWYKNIFNKENASKVDKIEKTNQSFDNLKIIRFMTLPGSKQITIICEQNGSLVVIKTNAKEWSSGGKLTAINETTGTVDNDRTKTLGKIVEWINEHYGDLGIDNTRSAAVTIFPADQIPDLILESQIDSAAREAAKKQPVIVGVVPDNKGGGSPVFIPTGTKGTLNGIVCDDHNDCWAKLVIDPFDIPDYPFDLKKNLMDATGSGKFVVLVNLNNIVKPEVPKGIFGSNMPSPEMALMLAQSGLASMAMPNPKTENDKALRLLREKAKKKNKLKK